MVATQANVICQMFPSTISDVNFLTVVLHVLILGKDVTYLCPFSGPARGVSFVTNYKLVFKADEVMSRIELIRIFLKKALK